MAAEVKTLRSDHDPRSDRGRGKDERTTVFELIEDFLLFVLLDDR